MTDTSQDKPKIIVDDDWKAQAQAEKERLAAESHAADKNSEGKPDEKSGADIPGAAPQDVPPLDFMGLINTLGMQAMMGMGGMEDPETKKRVVNLGLSKFNIDALALIKEKTKGNLTDEEAKLLEKMLYELQMSFINVSKQVAEIMKKQEKQAAAGDEKGKPAEADEKPASPAKN